MKRQFIISNGLKISYLIGGSGPPLILFHGGWMTGKMNWSEHFDALGKHFTVISPDHRGHGRTHNPEAKFNSYRRLAWDMIGFIEALNLDRKPVVMGHSSGALISLHISAFAPHLIARQVLIGIHPFIGVSDTFKRGMEKVFSTTDYTKPPTKWQYICRHPLNSLALWWAHQETPWFELLYQAWPMWIKPLALEKSDYNKITCPTLVITGSRDEFGSAEEAKALSKRISNANFIILKGENHMFVVDKPHLLQLNCIDFLRRTGDDTNL